MSAKATGVRSAYRRADGAIAGAAFVALFSATGAVAFNHHTDKFAMPEVVPAATLEIYAQSPVELAANAFADEQQCLAEVMYYEARGEGEDGQKAVAEVVMARVQSRYYPDSVCGVVHQGATRTDKACQFSFACDGSLKRRKERAAWDRSRQLASKIMSGAVQLGGSTENAIAFHTVDVAPGWSLAMERVTQIGNHVFYRRLPYAQTAALKAAVKQSEAAYVPSAEIAPASDAAGAAVDPAMEIELPVADGASGGA